MKHKSISNVAQITTSIEDGIWISGDIFNNPPDGTILIDTGPLSAGNYYFGFTITTSKSSVLDVEHRNSDNSGNTKRMRIRISSEGTEQIIFWNKIKILHNERIRIKCIGGVNGEIQCNIFYQEVI